jgi:hypothetical protein
MSDCTHARVSCINQHGLTRKYLCNSCGEVMMASLQCSTLVLRGATRRGGHSVLKRYRHKNSER